MSRKSSRGPKKEDVRAKLTEFARSSRLAQIAQTKGAGATITFLPEEQAVVFDPRVGLSVLQVGLLAGIPLGHSCGGNGTCTTCRILVESDLAEMPESARVRNELESERAQERGFAEHERLSCQLIAYDGLKVRRPNAALTVDETDQIDESEASPSR